MAPALVLEYVYLNTLQSVYMLLMAVCWIIGTAVLTVINLMLSQAFYLLQDFPQYSAMELLKMSCHIVKGHKGRLFYITLSFIPLYLLGILSCCIAFLWISPYENTVKANFYMDLMKNRKQGENSSPIEEHSEI